MRAGQQWEVCAARARHRPSGSTAGERLLSDGAAGLPGRHFRGANGWAWLARQRLIALLSTLSGARVEVEAVGGRAARSASVVRRNRARSGATQSGAWGPSSHCGKNPTSSQGRQSQDGRGVGAATVSSTGRPRRGEGAQSQTVSGRRAESGRPGGAEPPSPYVRQRGQRSEPSEATTHAQVGGACPVNPPGRLGGEERHRSRQEGSTSRPAAAEDGRLSGSECSAAREGEASFAE